MKIERSEGRQLKSFSGENRVQIQGRESGGRVRPLNNHNITYILMFAIRGRDVSRALHGLEKMIELEPWSNQRVF